MPTIPAIAMEVNEGGLALRTMGELQIGDQLQIEFQPIAWDRPILVNGVVHNGVGQRGHYGVMFLGMSPKQRGDLFLLCQIMRSAAVDYWHS